MHMHMLVVDNYIIPLMWVKQYANNLLAVILTASKFIPVFALPTWFMV